MAMAWQVNRTSSPSVYGGVEVWDEGSYWPEEGEPSEVVVEETGGVPLYPRSKDLDDLPTLPPRVYKSQRVSYRKPGKDEVTAVSEGEEVARLRRENRELKLQLQESAAREERFCEELSRLMGQLQEAEQAAVPSPRPAARGCAACSLREAELEQVKADAARQLAEQQREVARLSTIVELATRDSVKGAAHEVELEDALAAAQQELRQLHAEQDALVEEVATLRLRNQQLGPEVALPTKTA